MKKILLTFGLALLTVTAQASIEVPHCWSDDPAAPNKPVGIQDGLFAVTVSTQGLSAAQYASLLNFAAFSTDDALIEYQGDGADLSGETIEMDFKAETSADWNKLAAGNPNAEDFSKVKADILTHLEKLVQMKGVSGIRCINNFKLPGHGSVSLSN